MSRPAPITFEVVSRFSKNFIVDALYKDPKTRATPNNLKFKGAVRDRVQRELMLPLIDGHYRAFLKEGLAAYSEVNRLGSSDWSAPYSFRSGLGKSKYNLTVKHPTWPSLSRKYRLRKQREGRPLRFRAFSGELEDFLQGAFLPKIGAKERVVRRRAYSSSFRASGNQLRVKASYTLLRKVSDNTVHDFMVAAFATGEIDRSLMQGASFNDSALQKLAMFEGGRTYRSKNGPPRRVLRPLLGEIAAAYGNELRKRS